MHAHSHAGAGHQYPRVVFCLRRASENWSAETFELVNRCALCAWVFMLCVRYAESIVQQRDVLTPASNFVQFRCKTSFAHVEPRQGNAYNSSKMAFAFCLRSFDELVLQTGSSHMCFVEAAANALHECTEP